MYMSFVVNGPKIQKHWALIVWNETESLFVAEVSAECSNRWENNISFSALTENNRVYIFVRILLWFCVIMCCSSCSILSISIIWHGNNTLKWVKDDDTLCCILWFHLQPFKIHISFALLLLPVPASRSHWPLSMCHWYAALTDLWSVNLQRETAALDWSF